METALIFSIFIIILTIIIVNTVYLTDLKHTELQKDDNFTYVHIDDIDNLVPHDDDEYHLTNAVLIPQVVLPHEEEKHEEVQQKPTVLSGNVRRLENGNKQFSRTLNGESYRGLKVENGSRQEENEFVAFYILPPPGTSLKDYYAINHIGSVDDYYRFADIQDATITAYFKNGTVRLTIQNKTIPNDQLEYFIKNTDLGTEFDFNAPVYVDIN